MRKALIFILLAALLAGLCACGGKQKNKDMKAELAGKTFVYEKEGFGGEFTITLNEDGTYSFYEGLLSSYMGTGNWTVSDGILTMTETGGYDFTFRFSVQNGALAYLSEGSSAFPYVTVENGGRFIPR